MKRRHSLLIVVAFLAVFLLLWHNRSMTEGFEQASTIFVSVASYRDMDCMKTLEDMYAKAANPANIFVGLCEQNSEDADEVCLPVDFKYHDNVRRVTIPHTDAKGPTYARYVCSTLYKGESYFMQIDSHSRFADGWDQKAIASLNACPSSKPVLSGYPHDSKAYNTDETSVPTLCDSKWNDDGLPQFEAVIKNSKDFKGGAPLPIPFTSGGFVFGPGSLVQEVPYDPNLPMLFQGEEVLYGCRAWTSGYDFFTAPVNIVFHEYTRDAKVKDKKPAKFWEDISGWSDAQKTSAQRARRILGLENPIIKPGEDRYGLGNVRTIQEFWAYSGLDPKTKSSQSKQKFC